MFGKFRIRLAKLTYIWYINGICKNYKLDRFFNFEEKLKLNIENIEK